MAEFLNDLQIHGAGQIQFKTAAGANGGKIDQNGNDLVLTNPAGDILLGDGAADIYIGDGTNSVDLLFEQSASIKADDSATGVTITLGSSNTTISFGGSTDFANIVNAFSPTGANTIDIGTKAKPFKDIYAAHHVGGSSINYATSRGWVEDDAPLSSTQVGYYGGNFSRNGDASENAVVWGIDPFGNKALLWKAIGQTSDDDDDGGWNKDITIPANNNIGYLSYFYFKFDFTPDSSSDGQFYHGCGTASGQTINLADDSNNTNPYFNNGVLTTSNNGGAFIANRWYLSIGILQAYNNDTTDIDTMTGVYDVETGQKVRNGSEFKMGNNTTGQQHRAYLYYQSSTSSGNMYFWNPGFHAIDGSEPKLQDLLKRQVYLNDNVKAAFGNSNDLNIYHNGSHSFIQETGNGDLRLLGSTIRLQSGSEENMLVATPDAGVTLYYNNNTKFETYDAGVGVTGNAYLTSGNYIHFDNGVSNSYAIRKTGTTLEFKTGGTFDFGSGNATFSGDIQAPGIYVGSTNTSYDFYNNGTSYLNGAVTIDDNLTVTGKVITTEIESASTILLDAAADITIDAGGQDIILSDDGTIFGTLSNSSGFQIRSRVNNADMFFRGVDDGTEFNALTLDMSAGGNATFASDVTVGGNLIVNGTTTTINTATVEVEDNILQLNTTQGSPDTATAATSGISIYRGDGVTQASFIFDDADDTWDLTNNLVVNGNVGIGTTPASGVELHVNGEIRVDATDGIATRKIRSGYFSSTTDIRVEAGSAGDVILGDASAARLTLASDDNATFAGDIRVPNSGKLYTWNDHDDNYLKYDLWRASASAGMTIHNISADGEIYLKSGNATALTLDSSQNATFYGDITLGANHIGRDGDNYIGFETDNLIKFRVAGATQVKLADGVFAPQTDSDVDLGSDSTRFANVYADTLYGDGSNITGVTATDSTKVAKTGDTMTGSLIIDGDGSSSDVLKIMGSARIQMENASATDSFYISNTGGSNASVLDLGGALSLVENGNATFTGSATASSLIKSGGTSSQYLMADGSVSTGVASHNHDSRYTSIDASGDNYTFELEDESNFSGNKWYHVASLNSANGGLHIRGAILNHVENFASQKLDLAIQVREANDGGQLEIAGTVDVLHNAATGTDKAGVRVIKFSEDGTYDGFRVYVRVTRYSMVTLRLTQQGSVTFNTNHSSPATSEPAPVSGGHVEIDTSTLTPGHHIIVDSAAKATIADSTGNATFAGEVYTTGKLGIGTTDPNTDGYSFAEDLVIKGGNSSSDGAGMTILANGKQYGVIAFADSADSSIGEIFYDHNADRMYFRAGGNNNTLYVDNTAIVVTGNIGVSGTVDGRDIATDGTKLDTIDTNADVTPSWVPSSDPGYLTSSSTQSKYLRSDAADTATGKITFSQNAATIALAGTNHTYAEFYKTGTGNSRSAYLGFGASGNNHFNIVNEISGGKVIIDVNGGSVEINDNTSIDGNLTVTGDLNITGDINSYNVTDLDVVDKTITIGKGQTEANSGGSGIIVDGSSASILWDESNDTWDLNKGLDVAGNITVSGTVDGVDIAALAAANTGTNTGDQDLSGLMPKSGGTFTGSVTGTQFKLNNNVTNTNADSFFVYTDGGSTAYGMTLWNTSGTSGEWATMIFGPNQTSRRISFGKANSNFGTSHAGIDELAWLDLDNGNYFTDGSMYPSNQTTHYVSSGRIQNWQTAYTYSQVGHLPLSGGTMTGDIVMQDEMVNFAAGNPELPQFRGKRSNTDLDDRQWDTEGGWSYTTFENNTTNKPSTGLHNANGLLSFNTHSGDGTSNYMHQIAMTTNTNKLWHRRRNGSGGFGSWEEIFKGSVDYNNLSGTVPTWNQNTTGSAATLTTARTLTIGSTGKTFDGSGNVSWTLSEIGALPISGGTMTGAINMGNFNITGVNALTFNDPGPSEGVAWTNTKIFESPNDLTTNTSGNLQLVYNNTRRLTVDSGGIDVNGNIVVSGTVDGVDISGLPTFTTVGTNFAQLGDVSVASYIRINADETLSYLNAAQFLSAIGGVDGSAYLPLAGGTITGNTTFTGGTFGIHGTGSALDIGDPNSGLGRTALFAFGTDTFHIQQNSAGGNIQIETDDFIVKNHGAGETYIRAQDNSSVQLYYNNSKKFETTSAGASVTGDISVSGDIKDRSVPMVIHASFDDTTSSTSNLIVPLAGSITETSVSGASAPHFFTIPYACVLKRVIMKTVDGTQSSSFTTELKAYKNGSVTGNSSSGELTHSNSSVTWDPTANSDITYAAGDKFSLVYQKSATSKYWQDVAVTIVFTLTDYDI